MEFLRQLFPPLCLAFIIIFLIHYFKVFQGSSESVEFSKEKLTNYKLCDSPFMTHDELIGTVTPEVGDLLECKRFMGMYDHWMVYLGEGEVAHLTVDTERGTAIRTDRLQKVMGNSKCRVNNLDYTAEQRRLRGFSGEATARRSRQFVEEFSTGEFERKYNLMKFNCEHFATLCRYGEEFSQQASNANSKPVVRRLAETVVVASELVIDEL